MMEDEKDQLTRREAMKTIGAGVGVIATLPVLAGSARAQEMAAHEHSHNAGSFGSPRCFRLRVRESSCYVLLRINDADNRAISRRVFAFERKTRFLAATPEHQLTDARAN